MAKRKRKKQTKKGFEYKYEVLGIILLVASILGIGKLGVVGKLISSFALFLVGSVYMILLLTCFIVGAYLLIKREYPDFFSTKLIGIYVFSIGLLVIMHQDFVLQNDGKMMLIFRTTIDQLVASFNGIMNTGIVENWLAVGGGIIGGIFAIIFDKLFSYTGMQIVSWVFVIVGFCLFTGFSIIDYVKEKVANRKEKRSRTKEEKNEKEGKKAVIISNGEDEDDEDEVKDNKHIKITSIDDLKKVPVKEGESKVVAEAVYSDAPITNNEYQLPPLSLLNQPKKKQ